MAASVSCPNELTDLFMVATSAFNELIKLTRIMQVSQLMHGLNLHEICYFFSKICLNLQLFHVTPENKTQGN